MKTSNRRVFLFQAMTASTAVLATQSMAQAARLDEKDPQAQALGYVHDTTKVDAKKFPKHANAQKCSNCQLYAGKATDAWAPCPIFGNKQVAGPGWCSAYAKKA